MAPVPTAITDLSTTAASNAPAGTDSPSVLDDVQRAHAAFIRQLHDGTTKPAWSAAFRIPFFDASGNYATAAGFVRTAGGIVGIGTDAPTLPGTRTGVVVRNGSNANGAELLLQPQGASADNGLAMSATDTAAAVFNRLSTPLLLGTGNVERVRIDEAGHTAPGADNAQSLGSATRRWSVIYAGTGSINTSDEREKQDTGALPDAWLDAWADVQWVRFRFRDAVAAKGAGARWHVGLIAQRVRDAFAARGLDATAIGLLCRDVWTTQPEVRDAAGLVVQPARAAGERWGVRYEEALALEAALMRRTAERLAARVAALEAA